MNPEVWVASGHVGGFSDPLMDCKECKSRFRADKLVEDHMTENGVEVACADGWTNEELIDRIPDTSDNHFRRLVCHRAFINGAFTDRPCVDSVHFFGIFFKRECSSCVTAAVCTP